MPWVPSSKSGWRQQLAHLVIVALDPASRGEERRRHVRCSSRRPARGPSPCPRDRAEVEGQRDLVAARGRFGEHRCQTRAAPTPSREQQRKTTKSAEAHRLAMPEPPGIAQTTPLLGITAV